MNASELRFYRDKGKLIVPPEGGWKERTLYAVEVSFNTGNPIHNAVFFSGFLRDGNPANYNQVWNPSYDEPYTIRRLHYLKVLRELDVDFKR